MIFKQYLYLLEINLYNYRKKSKHILYLFILVILNSCATNSSVLDKESELLELPRQAEVTPFFEGKFELESVIPIETTNESLISLVNRVISIKDKIILLSKSDKSIFVINTSTGKIETCIKRIGLGPGESRSLLDIAFDDEKKQIILYNDYKKLLYFDLKGTFLREEKLDIEPLFENMVYENGNLLFYNDGEGYSCRPYFVYIYSLKDKTWEKVGADTKVDSPVRLYGSLMVKSKNIWFAAPFDFNMYLFGEKKIQNPYQLKLNIPSVSEDMVKMSSSKPLAVLKQMNKDQIIYCINSIRETDNFMVLKSNLPGVVLVNKESSKVYWESYIEDPCLGLKLAHYHAHDGDDNRIMFIVQAGEWLKRINNPNKISSKWKKVIESVKVDEESNPILVFYKEKEKDKKSFD